MMAYPMVLAVLAGAFLLQCRGERDVEAEKVQQAPANRGRERWVVGPAGNYAEASALIQRSFGEARERLDEKERAAVLDSLGAEEVVKLLYEVASLAPNGRDDGFLKEGFKRLIDLGATDDQLDAWLQGAPDHSTMLWSAGAAFGEKARKGLPAFLARFSDERDRNTLSARYYASFAEQQPLEAAKAYLAMDGGLIQSSDFAAILSSMPRDTDFIALSALVEEQLIKHPEIDSFYGRYALMDRWAKNDAQQAADFVWSSTTDSDGGINLIFMSWASSDPQGASEWLTRHQDGGLKYAAAASQFLDARAAYEPEHCQELAEAIRDPGARARAYETIFKRWGEYEPEVAGAARKRWVEGR